MSNVRRQKIKPLRGKPGRGFIVFGTALLTTSINLYHHLHLRSVLRDILGGYPYQGAGRRRDF